MTDEREKFVSRWSRLKREAREQAEDPPPKADLAANPRGAAPEVPPVDKLTFDSDYRDFLHPGIDEDTRRAALKKLFSDPRFNVIDDMDIDIEDYSKYAPLSAAVVASLKQTQNILQWAREREEEEKRRERERDGSTQVTTTDSQPEPPPEAAQPGPAAAAPSAEASQDRSTGPKKA